MSNTLTPRRRLAVLAVGLVTGFSVFTATAPSAGALARPPVVNAPEYCLALYGNPNPCPLPDRPEPVDPTCLRVDIEPLHCPYLP